LRLANIRDDPAGAFATVASAEEVWAEEPAAESVAIRRKTATTLNFIHFPSG
jgi:hypothetical protein